MAGSPSPSPWHVWWTCGAAHHWVFLIPIFSNPFLWDVLSIDHVLQCIPTRRLVCGANGIPQRSADYQWVLTHSCTSS